MNVALLVASCSSNLCHYFDALRILLSRPFSVYYSTYYKLSVSVLRLLPELWLREKPLHIFNNKYFSLATKQKKRQFTKLCLSFRHVQCLCPFTSTFNQTSISLYLNKLNCSSLAYLDLGMLCLEHVCSEVSVETDKLFIKSCLTSPILLDLLDK